MPIYMKAETRPIFHMLFQRKANGIATWAFFQPVIAELLFFQVRRGCLPDGSRHKNVLHVGIRDVERQSLVSLSQRRSLTRNGRYFAHTRYMEGSQQAQMASEIIVRMQASTHLPQR